MMIASLVVVVVVRWWVGRHDPLRGWGNGMGHANTAICAVALCCVVQDMVCIAHKHNIRRTECQKEQQRVQSNKQERK